MIVFVFVDSFFFSYGVETPKCHFFLFLRASRLSSPSSHFPFSLSPSTGGLRFRFAKEVQSMMMMMGLHFLSQYTAVVQVLSCWCFNWGRVAFLFECILGKVLLGSFLGACPGLLSSITLLIYPFVFSLTSFRVFGKVCIFVLFCFPVLLTRWYLLIT